MGSKANDLATEDSSYICGLINGLNKRIVMNIVDEIVREAPKAHEDLVDHLGFNSKKLRCTFGYLSKSAFISSAKTDLELMRLMFVSGIGPSIFGGAGVYLLSKRYPYYTEFLFLLVIILSITFYAYKRQKIISKCETIKLNKRPVLKYTCFLAKRMEFRTLLLGVMMFWFFGLFLLYVMYRVYLNEHFAFFSLMVVFDATVWIWCFLFTRMLYIKLLQ